MSSWCRDWQYERFPRNAEVLRVSDTKWDRITLDDVTFAEGVDEADVPEEVEMAFQELFESLQDKVTMSDIPAPKSSLICIGHDGEMVLCEGHRSYRRTFVAILRRPSPR